MTFALVREPVDPKHPDYLAGTEEFAPGKSCENVVGYMRVPKTRKNRFGLEVYRFDILSEKRGAKISNFKSLDKRVTLKKLGLVNGHNKSGIELNLRARQGGVYYGYDRLKIKRFDPETSSG